MYSSYTASFLLDSGTYVWYHGRMPKEYRITVKHEEYQELIALLNQSANLDRIRRNLEKAKIRADIEEMVNARLRIAEELQKSIDALNENDTV